MLDAPVTDASREFLDLLEFDPAEAAEVPPAANNWKRVAQAIPAWRHAEATEMLDLLLAFFADGARWTRGRLQDQHDNRCLVGGLQYVRQHHGIDPCSMRNAERCLLRALPERCRSLPTFNDSSSFAEVRALILKARSANAEEETL